LPLGSDVILVVPRGVAVAAVLVVDDDADHCELISKVLTRQGHHVACALNGWEALLVLDSSNVDLIILDLMMPGMDGATFLGIMRNDKRRKHIPVIAVTALAEGPLASRVRALDVKKVFRKAEYELSELVESVHQNLCPPERRAGDSGDSAPLN
jgi:CheY-like chemotaxis protein